jgi:hypothetical protein
MTCVGNSHKPFGMVRTIRSAIRRERMSESSPRTICVEASMFAHDRRIPQPQLAWRTQDAIVAIGPATVFSPHQAGAGTLPMKRL